MHGATNIKLAVTVYHAGTGDILSVLWEWRPYFNLGIMVSRAERM
jgi:hypothetical protein